MSLKIIPFRNFKRAQKPRAKSFKRHVDEFVRRLVERDLADFGENLCIARGVWRLFPELVTAPEFPAQLRGPMKRQVACYDPDGQDYFGAPVVSRKRIREHREMAEEFVRAKHPEAM